MRKAITFSVLSLFLSGYAQTGDSVHTNAGGNEVYYNLKDQERTLVDINSWDIGFTVQNMDASIMINDGKTSGTMMNLYVYSADTSDWATVDTNGFDFEAGQLRNSEESWDFGAFSNMGTTHPDYGWGTYNNSNHNIDGSRLFLIGDPASKLYQIVIVQLSASGVYKIKIGDLGGANSSYLSFDKNDEDFQNQNFAYFSFSDKQIKSLEPQLDWQLLFTRYIAAIPAGPNTLYYTVTGVKINKGLLLAERTGVDVTDDDTSGLNWDENLTEIGYDWKTYNNGTGKYEITEDLSYFIKDAEGRIWKIYFTNFKGGADGEFVFNMERIDDASSIGIVQQHFRLFPQPAAEQLFIESSSGENAQLRLYTLNGHIIQQQNLFGNTKNTVDISSLSPGIYVVRIETGQGLSQFKIVIE